MDAHAKPLPTITDQTRPFWEAARAGRLLLQQCQRCAAFNFLPKPWCIACGSRALRWTQAQPYGTVYAYTVSRTVAMNTPAWACELPLILALVELDDGVRLYAQVQGCAPDAVRIGLRVGVRFAFLAAELAIPVFYPVP